MSGNNQLEQLKEVTVVVADTGDFESMRAYMPRDATTNPSLILKAAQQPDYEYLLDMAVKDGKRSGLSGQKQLDYIISRLLILFGIEILDIVPGRVSTEVDARLSFDTRATVDKAREIIKMYEAEGADRERILIKIAATWEGIQAAKELRRDKVRCNLTLLFSQAQAIACAEAQVQLVSPFVGRIYDWYKNDTGKEYVGAEDPGVQSVSSIYNYYKHFDYNTEVMGASFRNVGQIQQLAGCDLLTISPDLLEELQQNEAGLPTQLTIEAAEKMNFEKISLDEVAFRYMHNEDAMGVEKLAEGIRKFSADIITLEKLITSML